MDNQNANDEQWARHMPTQMSALIHRKRHKWDKWRLQTRINKSRLLKYSSRIFRKIKIFPSTGNVRCFMRFHIVVCLKI